MDLYVPVCGDVQDALTDYLADVHPGDPLFEELRFSVGISATVRLNSSWVCLNG